MGLFNKLKNKETSDFKNAYVGKPNFYNGKDGKPFGVFALTEDTLTLLPKNPKVLYKVDNMEIDDWKLMFVSITDGVLKDTDYYVAIDKLKKYVIKENTENILIKGLSLEELKNILK